jgi:hypothetical protein
MAFQVVIPVEGLLALGAFKRALRLRRRTAWVVDIEVMRVVGRQPWVVAVAGHPSHS